MDDKKLICPVKRIKKSNVDIDIEKDNINIKADINIKNPVTSITEWIYNQLKNAGKI